MAPPTTPDKRPSPEMFDEIIEVKVGKAPEPVKSFYLHKGIAAFYSGYLEAAINGSFAEAKSKVIRLPEEDVKTFEDFTLWLYTRNFRDIPACQEAYDTLVDLCLFADRRDIPLLGNAAITALRDSFAKFWQYPTLQVKSIYQNTVSNSKLRRFIVVYLAYGCDESVLRHGTPELWPKDALWDVLKLVWGREHPIIWTKEKLAAVDMCTYHRHEEGEKCKKS